MNILSLYGSSIVVTTLQCLISNIWLHDNRFSYLFLAMLKSLDQTSNVQLRSSSTIWIPSGTTPLPRSRHSTKRSSKNHLLCSVYSSVFQTMMSNSNSRFLIEISTPQTTSLGAWPSIWTVFSWEKTSETTQNNPFMDGIPSMIQSLEFVERLKLTLQSTVSRTTTYNPSLLSFLTGHSRTKKGPLVSCSIVTLPLYQKTITWYWLKDLLTALSLMSIQNLRFKKSSELLEKPMKRDSCGSINWGMFGWFRCEYYCY